MATINVLKLSELEQKKRIDAEFYSTEYMNPIKKLKRLECKKIGQCCFVTSGSTPLDRDPELRSGILLLKTANIREGYIDIISESPFFIDDYLDERLRSSRLKPNDVLINIVGATLEVIGRVAMVPEDFPRANITQAMSLIRLTTDDYLPEYIFAFLNSKYGRMQVCRMARPTAQYNLNHEETKSIIVPKLAKDFQNEIKEIYHKFYDSYRESIRLYFQAEKLLLEELGLKDFKPKYELSYTANLSEAFGAHRLDAQYYQLAYEEVIKRILNYQNGHAKLLSYAESIKPDFDPTKYPDKPFSYVELADIDASIGVIHGASEIKGDEAPSRARRILRKGDVIVSSVEGSLEKVALVSKEHEGFLASTGFFQFRPRRILPELLLVLSKSIVLQMQLKKECTGTILTAVPNESLKRILVPKIPSKIQQKIALLVQQSHEARKKAKDLLEEAKIKVEKAIESKQVD